MMASSPSAGWFVRLLRRPSLLFALGLWLFISGLLLWWPIVLTDTDMWYHLAGGRYLFTHHAIPSDSFFSFLAPARPWVDYYWLFQALVYQLYAAWGYQALVVLRALAYCGTTGLILRFLLKGVKSPAWLSWATFVAVLYELMLISRHIPVRPHLASYALIVSFLYLLEYHPKRAWLLPGLAILWCNLHGIEYPVMLLILGAYGLEHVVRALRGAASARQAHLAALVPLGLTAATLLLPPHSVRLLPLPFHSLGYVSHFVIELSPVTASQVLSLHVTNLTPSYFSMCNIFLLCTALAVLTALVRRTLQLHHLLLWGGGLILLSMGVRFMFEYALLSLPLLRDNPFCSPKQLSRRLPRPTQLSLVVLLMVLCLQNAKGHFGNRPTYPFSAEGLPRGIGAFLSNVGHGGLVLNDPNEGGYLQWVLYPTYRIFMDMEIGSLFSASDFLLAHQVLKDPRALRRLLDQYHPDFIAAPYERESLKNAATDLSDYALVFFDDVYVLYASRRQQPEVASQHELAGVDITALHKRKPDAIDTDPATEPILRYVRSMLTIDPDCGMTNYIAGLAYLKSGVYDHALEHAEAIIRNFPHRASGFELKGDALRGLKRYSEAIGCYQLALQSEGSRPEIYKKMGAAYSDQGRHREAYQAYEQGVDVLSLDTDVEDLYNLATSGRLSGHRDEARTILHYLYEHRLRPEDDQWFGRVREDLAAMGVPVDAPSHEADATHRLEQTDRGR